MKAVPRILYFLCVIGLALVAAVAFSGVGKPSMITILTRAVFVAAVCAAPGIIYRKLWPLAIVLVPVGCYVLLRTIIPVPATVQGLGGQYHFYVDQLYAGMVFYKSSLFPLPLSGSPALRMLLAFIAYWLVALAAFLALSLRRPLPAVALCLVLVGFGLTVDNAERVLWTAFLFVVLSACLLVLSRALKRSGWRLRETVAGAVVGVAASCLALLLLVTAPSVAADPWRDWRAWDPFNPGHGVYTFNWLQNYPDLLDPDKNAVVMTVESASPSYWRANALDEFTGSAWVTSQAFVRHIEGESDGDLYVYSIPETETAPEGTVVGEDFSIESVSTYYLFAGGDPLSLTLGQSVSLYMNDARSLRVTAALGPSLHYSLAATIPEITPPDLVALGRDYSDDLDKYLTLPFDRLADLTSTDKEAEWQDAIAESGPVGRDWTGLYTLNERILGNASDPYEITLRIERHLRQFYSYTLSPQESDYSSPYAAFLFHTRSGYCQHFAGAMAILLRYNGIPSRIAVGFATGEADRPGVYVVSRNDAHAWVEAYFPGVGWVAFDPTPGRNLPTAGGSSTSPGFVNPFAVAGNVSPGGLPPETPDEDILENELTGEPGATPVASWWSEHPWVPWILGLVVLLAGWPVVRRSWRHRRLHRGPWDSRLQASLGLLRRELKDHGISVSPAQTLEELLAAVGTRLELQIDAEFVLRADAVLFGGRRANQTDYLHAEALRQRVLRRLRRRRGWVRTGLSWYGVPRLSLRGHQA